MQKMVEKKRRLIYKQKNDVDFFLYFKIFKLSHLRKIVNKIQRIETKAYQSNWIIFITGIAANSLIL